MFNVRASKRRLVLSIIGLLAAVVLFTGRLIDIQVVQAAEYNKASLGKRSVAVVTFGARGNIVDTNGVLLAASVDRFDITVSPKSVAEIKRDGEKVPVAQQIQELSAATGVDVATISSVLSKDPDSDFAYIAKSVTLEVRDKVKELGIWWVYPRVHPDRTYPNGAVAGNLVGFMNKDGPGAGVELTYDECLAATDGSSTYEKSKDGVLLPGSTVTQKEAVNGGTVKLTIDSDFQWYVQAQLATQAKATGSDWATAVVVRISDGHLMAVADYPSVDSNDVNGVPNTAFGSLAFSTPYEPGSTFKPMTAAMLIDQGLAGPGTGIVVPGRLYYPSGQYIRDVYAHPDLRLTMTGVLMNSSNIGISLLSRNLSSQTRYDYLKKFGVATTTAVGFNGESSGSLRNPKDSPWDPISADNISFGQGVSATSAQMASIYQTLGNNGVRMPLTLVEGCTLPDGTVIDLPETAGTQVVSEQAADQTVAMLESIVTKGPVSRLIQIPGYRMAAKTGTAEVALNGIYTKDRIVSLAGMIPAEDPQYAVVVTLGKPDTIKSSVAAAPTFKNIMTQVIKTFRIQPSTTPAADYATEW